MKKETLQWVKDAYKTEADCITEMLNHLNEEEFSKAIEILINAERQVYCLVGCTYSRTVIVSYSD